MTQKQKNIEKVIESRNANSNNGGNGSRVPQKLTQEQLNKKTFMGLVEKYKNQIEVALPKHLTAERMVRLAITATSRNEKLLLCDPKTVFGSVIQASQLGLELGIMGQAHLVPFYNNKTRQFEAQFMPGYQGLINLAQRSGQIKTIHADVVHENDFFEFGYGTDGYLRHKPNLMNRGNIIAFYGYAETKDGGEYFEVMSIQDMEAHRDKYTKQKNKEGKIFGTWVDEFEKMGKKTVLIQVCKLLPKSIEMQTAIALENLADSGVSQGLSLDNIDTETGSITINDDYSGDAEEAEAEEVAKEPENRVEQHIANILAIKSPQDVEKYQQENKEDFNQMPNDAWAKVSKALAVKMKEFD